MEAKPWRISRPRQQTPEQQAQERAIRERFQQDKPSLEQLVANDDAEFVATLGEYWEWLKAVGELKAAREAQRLTLDDVARRAMMEVGVLSRLEEGHMEGASFAAICQYAGALGRRVHVGLAKAG